MNLLPWDYVKDYVYVLQGVINKFI